MSDTPWPHFTRAELACKCGCGKGADEMDLEFMKIVEELRVNMGFPFHVTSGFRCPAHNSAVAETGEDGPHTKGRALDIEFWNPRAYAFASAALSRGLRIGVSQRPGKARFIHVDNLGEERGQAIWSY